MTLPIPSFCPSGPEAPATTQVEAWGDGAWHRWIFKAPPLRVEPPTVDLRTLAPELAPKPASR